MKSYKYIMLMVLALPLSSFGATKLLLRDTISPLGTIAQAGAGYGCANGKNNYVYRVADTTQGTTIVTKTFAPTSSNPPCQWQTANTGGEYLAWISAPLAAAVTISGSINYKAGCDTISGGFKVGFRFVVKRWSSQKGGIASTVHTSADSGECDGLAMTIAAATPTSTSFSVGDRIVILLEIRNKDSSWTGDGVTVAQLFYGGPASGKGDSFANFTENFTFAADTANGRPSVQ